MKQKLEHGCYIDNTRGVYSTIALCELANSFGWDGRVPTEQDVWDQYDEVHDYADEAMDWLNCNVADEDSRFCWYEGSVMYWSNEDWEEVYG